MEIKNCEGYIDTAAAYAIEKVSAEEADIDKQMGTVIHIFKSIAHLSGFEITNRIHLKHKKSGRKYK